MSIKTTTTSITSASSARSNQAKSYQYPSGNGVVVTGSVINSNSNLYLDVTTPGQARTFTTVSGGAGSTITQIVYLDSSNNPTNATAVSTTGGNIKIVGTGFTSGSQVYVNNALVSNTFANSTAIIAVLPAGINSNVTCFIFNSSNSGGAISANSVRYSGAPSWVSSGAVSSYNDVSSNIALQASGDGTLSYTLQSGSGSLPTGITLLSSGYLTGTATGYTSDTVSTFTLVVTDSEGQATQQAFSYTVFIGDTYFKQTTLLLSSVTANNFISDSSTNNFLVTRVGDTRPSRLSPYWPGGWSGYFDGTGDNLTISGNLSLNSSTQPFTVEGWVYMTANGGCLFSSTFSTTVAIAVGFPSTTAGFGAADVNNQTNGRYVAFGTYTGSAWSNVVSSSQVTLNSWTHIACVFNGSASKIFINGTDVTVGTLSTWGPYNQSTWYIGRRWDLSGTVNYVTGYISNLRYVRGAALYTANFTPSTTSLSNNTAGNISLLTLRGSTLVDDSPYNLTLTRVGDVALTNFSPFNSNPHTITANTYSVSFDGTGDYLTSADTTLRPGTSQFTFEAWVYVTSTALSGLATFFSYTDTPGVIRVFFALNTANPTVNPWINQSSQGATSAGFQRNTWTHIAVVRDATNLKVYINGNSYLSVVNSTDLNGGTFSIGGEAAGNNPYTGYISNFRFVKGTAVYTANFTPSTSSLTAMANTAILTCQANTIIDSNTTPKTITVNGNPNVSISNPFGETISNISNYTWSANSYGSSAYFDGTGDYLVVTQPATSFMTGLGDWTWEAWVYPNSFNGPQYSCPIFNTGTAADNLLLRALPTTANSASLNLYAIDTVGGLPLGAGGTSGGSLWLGRWSHVAAVRNSGVFTVFINGNPVINVTNQTTANIRATTANLAIGFGQAGTNPYWNGYISDARITNGSALYANTFIPPSAPVSNRANVSLLTLQNDLGSNTAQFVDQSYFNSLITRTGNVSQSSFSPLNPTSWSGYFDGTGDYLALPNNIALLFQSTLDWTVEFWFNTTGTGGAIVDTYYVNTSPYGGLVVNLINGTINTYDGGANRATTGTYNDGKWHHFAWTNSAGTSKVFIDGVNTAVGGVLSWSTSSNVYRSTAQLWIGAQNWQTNAYTGWISNFRIIQNTALYTANFTPSTTAIGPITNTSLLTLRGPILSDDSGYNFTITKNGDTKIVPFGPFSPQTITPDGYSYRFSNASDYISTTSSNLALGTNDWTIETWVWPRFSANSGIFQISNVQYGLTNSNLNTVALGFSSSNKAIVRVANAQYTSTGTTITANAWTHLALVKSSNVSKLYINGTLDSTIGTSGSITDTVNYTGTTNIGIGGYGSTSTLANAYIGDFRVVYNSAVYTTNFTAPAGPLTAVNGTTLLTCQTTTVADSSLANLTITANAGVQPSKFNPYDETVTVGQSYSASDDGGSAYFDGTGDYLTTPAGSATTIIGGTMSASLTFTIDCWICPFTTTSSAIVIGDFAPAAATNYWGFGPDNTNKLQFYWYDGAGKTAVGNSVIPLGSWSHIAVSVTAGAIKLFVNGQLQTITGTSTLTTASGSLAYLTLGSYNNGTLTAYVSGLRVLKGTALYTASFVPPSAPPSPTTANTTLLLNFNNSSLIDSTGRTVLETANDARVTTSNTKLGTGSYYFDGTGDYLTAPLSSNVANFGTGDFTVESWIYTSLAAQVTLIDTRAAVGATAYTLSIHANGRPFVYNGSANITSNSGLTANTWTHLAYVKTSNVLKMFVNGTTVYTAPDTSSYTGVGNVTIAANVNGGSSILGYLDDLRVTKGYARYTADFTVPTGPFVVK